MTGRVGTSARAVALLAITAVAACSAQVDARATDSMRAGQRESEGSGRVINVEVRTIQPTEFAERIRLTGTVTAHRDVNIAAEESGIIRALPVAKGSTVVAGQVIARIDDRILRAQVAQARAAADLAKEVADRRSRLFKEDNIGSELAVLEAQSAAQQAAANLEVLTERLARTVIRAPVPGVLDTRLVEVGSMVTFGTLVGRVIEVNPVKISAGVPERFAPVVRPGTMVQITFDVLPERTFTARIGYVGTAINAHNRTFPIEIVLPNAEYSIKPEMVANVEVVTRTLASAIVVPQEALVRVENGFVAFVVQDTAGRPVARVRQVSLGPSQRNQVVVTSGLSTGDRLIVVGQQQVADGDRVTVVGSVAKTGERP